MGGAVFNHQGTLTITNSTLSGNTAAGGASGTGGFGGQGLGGAIFNLNGAVSLDSATVAFNAAADGGGAIYNLGYLGIDVNAAADGGGAVYNLGYLGVDTGTPAAYSAQTTVTNSILSNSAGGVDVVADAPSAVASGSPNTATSTVSYNGPNIVMTSSRQGAGDMVGVTAPITTDPGLARLALNGGTTPTHAITTTSPAFDAGDTTLATDQGGTARPQGSADDIGAFELPVATSSAPVITVPSNITVTESSAGAGAAVAFAVTATGTPTPTTIACGEAGTSVISGDTFAVGTHTISCTATNGVGSASDSFSIIVLPADRPPVPDAGGPYTVAEGSSLALDASGTTDADHDPLAYSWDVNGDGTFGDATGVAPTLTWAQLTTLGINDGPATMSVSVRVSDGPPGATVTSSAVPLTVTDVAPTGSISGPSDVTRGVAGDWTFGATDPSSIDQAAGFTYSIDWGDGRSSTVPGGSPQSTSHTYADVGVFTVTMTATDKDGGPSAAVTRTVTVGGAELVSGVCGGTTLIVGGTSGNDAITTNTGKRSSSITVSLNGTSLGSFTVGRVVVLAAGGNDTVTFASTLNIARTVYGGDGNDTILGGNGNAIDFGGPGNDNLSTGNGADILVGGTGADALAGGNGNDVLIAGSTSFEDPTAAGQAFWCGVQSAWMRGSSSALIASGASRNLFDDGVADTLNGQLGTDLFYLNLVNGVLDTSDARASEVKHDLS